MQTKRNAKVCMHVKEAALSLRARARAEFSVLLDLTFPPEKRRRGTLIKRKHQIIAINAT